MNQRRSGHNWEREIVNLFKKELSIPDHEIGTTRLHSKFLDNKKIDIWFQNPIGIDIQAKETTTGAKEAVPLDAQYLDSIETKQEKVLFYKAYRKGNKRKVIGTYVIISVPFFFKLLKSWITIK